MHNARNNAALPKAEIAVPSHKAAEIEKRMLTAHNAAPKNIATTDSTLLANLGFLPFAIEESAPMPVIVSVRTVVVRSGIASLRTPRLDREARKLTLHLRAHEHC